MNKTFFLILAMACGSVAMPSAFAQSSTALSNKQCHQAFQAAKAGNHLNGQNYDAFKASNCKSSNISPSLNNNSAKSSAMPTQTGSTQTEPMQTGKVVFPNAVASQFASLPAGKARMQTCLAQYNTNKTNGANGGLKWVQKGGGYWPQCTKHLQAIGTSAK